MLSELSQKPKLAAPTWTWRSAAGSAGEKMRGVGELSYAAARLPGRLVSREPMLQLQQLCAASDTFQVNQAK